MVSSDHYVIYDGSLFETMCNKDSSLSQVIMFNNRPTYAMLLEVDEFLATYLYKVFNHF